jgi:hypothetical protein
MQPRFKALRARMAFALAASLLLTTRALTADAAVFAQDFGAGCGTMALAGRTITCNDGTRIAIDISVMPGCARFALGQQRANYTLVCATPNATGLWWRADENGRGTWISHQGDAIFAVDYAYDVAAAPRWRTLIGSKGADGTFVGDVYATNGPAFTAAVFDPLSVVSSRVGSGWIALDDAEHLRADFADGTARALVRQTFGPLPACSFGLNPDSAMETNYTDLWWNPGESGWGINLAHQGDTIFAAWFTYGLDGSPLWLVFTAQSTGPGTYAGDLYRAVGPAGPAMQATAVGSATLTFANGNNATFAYSAKLTGMPVAATQTKAITREIFVAPGSACH